MKDVHQYVIHEHLYRFENVQDEVYDVEYQLYQIQINHHQYYELFIFKLF